MCALPNLSTLTLTLNGGGEIDATISLQNLVLDEHRREGGTSLQNQAWKRFCHIRDENRELDPDTASVLNPTTVRVQRSGPPPELPKWLQDTEEYEQNRTESETPKKQKSEKRRISNDDSLDPIYLTELCDGVPDDVIEAWHGMFDYKDTSGNKVTMDLPTNWKNGPESIVALDDAEEMLIAANNEKEKNPAYVAKRSVEYKLKATLFMELAEQFRSPCAGRLVFPRHFFDSTKGGRPKPPPNSLNALDPYGNPPPVQETSATFNSEYGKKNAAKPFQGGVRAAQWQCHSVRRH